MQIFHSRKNLHPIDFNFQRSQVRISGKLSALEHADCAAGGERLSCRLGAQAFRAVGVVPRRLEGESKDRPRSCDIRICVWQVCSWLTVLVPEAVKQGLFKKGPFCPGWCGSVD